MKRILVFTLIFALLFAASCGKPAEVPGEDLPDGDQAAGDGWRYEIVTPDMQVVCAVAEAFYSHRADIQCDGLSMERVTRSAPRYEYAAPEDATYQRNVYFECSAFCGSVYRTAFGYTPPGAQEALSDTYANTGGERVFFYNGEGERSDAEEALEKALFPGDIIYYSTGNERHSVIYMGEGVVMYSGCAGDGGSYDYEGAYDRVEASGLFKAKLFAVLPAHDVFSSQGRVCVLRPLKLGLTATEDAKIRLEKLRDVVITKTSSAPAGVSISPGDTVTVSISVQNVGKAVKTVTVTDRPPQHAKMLQEDGGESTEPLFRELSVPAGGTQRISYTLRIDEDCPKGEKLHLNNTKVCGMAINDTPILVGNTLTAEQQAAISRLAVSEIAVSDQTGLIKEIYRQAGIKGLPDISLFEGLDALFDGFPMARDLDPAPEEPAPDSNEPEELPEEKGGENGAEGLPDETPEEPAPKQNTAVPLFGSESIYAKMQVPGLYGGKNCKTAQNGERIKAVKTMALMPGDIVLFSTDGESANAFLYLGGGEAAVIVSGKAARADCGQLLSKMFGQFCFCVLRPSFVF